MNHYRITIRHTQETDVYVRAPDVDAAEKAALEIKHDNYWWEDFGLEVECTAPVTADSAPADVWEDAP